MSTASVLNISAAHVRPVGFWIQAGLNALRNTFAPSPAASKPQLTRQQEADQLRAYACTLVQEDPSYAEDLFAAAERHELG